MPISKTLIQTPKGNLKNKTLNITLKNKTLNFTLKTLKLEPYF